MRILVLLAMISGATAARAAPLVEAWRVNDGCGLEPTRSPTTVYTVVKDQLHAIDAATGKDRNAKVAPSAMGLLIGVVEPVLVLARGKTISGVAVADGTERWHRTFDTTALVAGGSDVVGVTVANGALSAERLDAVTGTKKWAATLAAPKLAATLAATTMSADDTRVLVALDDTADHHTELVVLDGKTGKLAWHTKLAWARDPFPQLAGKQVIVADDKTLHILDATSGKEVGKLALPHGQKLESDLWIASGGARAITSDATAAFAIDLATRKVVWSAPAGDDAVIVSASDAAGAAIIDHEHGVRILDTATGAVRAAYGIVPGFDALAGANGSFVVCDDDDLIGLAPATGPAPPDISAKVTGRVTCTGGCPAAGLDYRLGALHGRLDKTSSFAGTLVGRGRYGFEIRKVGDTSTWTPMAAVNLADKTTYDLGTVVLHHY